MEKKCVKCGQIIDSTAKFCGYCGAEQPMAKYCPQCGTPIVIGSRFCTKCGYKLDGTVIPPTTVEENGAENKLPSKKNNNIFTKVCIAVFLVVVACAVAYGLLYCCDNKSKNTETTNGGADTIATASSTSVEENNTEGKTKTVSEIEEKAEKVEKVKKSDDGMLRGKIGPVTVAMKLDVYRGGSGWYYYNKYPDEIYRLEITEYNSRSYQGENGIRHEVDDITVQEYESDGFNNGTFVGTYTDGRFRGTYSNYKGKSYKFDLE